MYGDNRRGLGPRVPGTMEDQDIAGARQLQQGLFQRYATKSPMAYGPAETRIKLDIDPRDGRNLTQHRCLGDLISSYAQPIVRILDVQWGRSIGPASRRCRPQQSQAQASEQAVHGPGDFFPADG